MRPIQSQRSLSDRLFGSSTRGLFSSDIGDDRDSAKNLGTFKRGSSYDHSGDVGGDDLDFFKFKLDQRTNITATLKNKSDGNQPIAISILDQNGKTVSVNNQLLFNNIEAGDTEKISARLKKGTYFIRLQSADGQDEDYDFDLTPSGSSSSSLFDNAKTIGRLDRGEVFRDSGSVGGSDVDYYQFDIDDTSRIRAKFTNDSNADIAFSILDDSGKVAQTGNGRFLFDNVAAGDTETLFAPTLTRGTYYLRAQSAEGRNEDYFFKLKRVNATITPI